MNTINDRLTFGAKLDYSRITKNRARWSKIAEAFENKTKQQPNDVLYVEPNEKGGIYFWPIYANKKLEITESYDKGEISKDAMNILKKLSNGLFAEKLKKIFLIRKKADNMLVDYFNVEDKYKLTKNIDGDILENFFYKFLNLRLNFVKNKLQEDKFFKNIEVVDIL